MHDVYHIHYRELLGDLDPESVDLFLTDIPYNTQESQRNRGTHPRLVNFFPVLDEEDWFWVLTGMSRALKPSGRALLMTDEKAMDQVKRAVQLSKEAHKRNYRTTQLSLVYWDALVWNKINRGMGYHGAKQHEFIMIFEKLPAKYKYGKDRSLLEAKSVLTRTKYPTEKPIELARQLIEFASQPGDFIVDPFCGSGTFGVAAKQLNRDFVGGDINEEAVQLTEARLREVKA